MNRRRSASNTVQPVSMPPAHPTETTMRPPTHQRARGMASAAGASDKDEGTAQDGDVAKKYRELKDQYSELEQKYKEVAEELRRAGEQNLKLSREKDVLHQRITELEAQYPYIAKDKDALASPAGTSGSPAHSQPPPPIAPSTPSSSGYPRNVSLSGLRAIMVEENTFSGTQTLEQDTGRMSVSPSTRARKRPAEEELGKSTGSQRSTRRRRSDIDGNSTQTTAVGTSNTPLPSISASSVSPNESGQPPYMRPSISPIVPTTLYPTMGPGVPPISYPAYLSALNGNGSPSTSARPSVLPPYMQIQQPIMGTTAIQPSQISQPGPSNASSQRPAKPKRLKAHTVTTKSYNIPTVPRDKEGKPMLPLNVGIMTLVCLGEVCTREHFHTERYIFPVGYEVTRRYYSAINPNVEVVYHCTILDGGDGPKFQIVPGDQTDKPIIAGTATGAWSGIVKRANAIRSRQHSNSVSGPDFFGLGQNSIKHLIQELPNADRLRDYVWQNYVEGGPLGGRHAAVIPALPEEYESSIAIGPYYTHERDKVRQRSSSEGQGVLQMDGQAHPSTSQSPDNQDSITAQSPPSTVPPIDPSFNQQVEQQPATVNEAQPDVAAPQSQPLSHLRHYIRPHERGANSNDPTFASIMTAFPQTPNGEDVVAATATTQA